MSLPPRQHIKEEPTPDDLPSTAQARPEQLLANISELRASLPPPDSQQRSSKLYRLENNDLFADRGSQQLKAAKDALWVLVSDIERQLCAEPSADAQRWLSAIELIRTQDQEPVTNIRVRGATGCGKTTAINAICGIQNMMPTDSSKSTTAAVTELHYHDRTGFHIEVEYVTEEEWTGIILGVKSLLEDDEDVLRLAREQRCPLESANRLLGSALIGWVTCKRE